MDDPFRYDESGIKFLKDGRISAGLKHVTGGTTLKVRSSASGGDIKFGLKHVTGDTTFRVRTLSADPSNLPVPP